MIIIDFSTFSNQIFIFFFYFGLQKLVMPLTFYDKSLLVNNLHLKISEKICNFLEWCKMDVIFVAQIRHSSRKPNQAVSRRQPPLITKKCIYKSNDLVVSLIMYPSKILKTLQSVNKKMLLFFIFQSMYILPTSIFLMYFIILMFFKQYILFLLKCMFFNHQF